MYREQTDSFQKRGEWGKNEQVREIKRNKLTYEIQGVMGMKCTVWGRQSKTVQYLCRVTDCNQTCGDHFEMYRNVKSLY